MFGKIEIDRRNGVRSACAGSLLSTLCAIAGGAQADGIPAELQYTISESRADVRDHGGYTSTVLTSGEESDSTDGYFGRSMSVDGDFAIIGAPYEGEGGAVYAFRRSDGEWTLEARLVPTGGTASGEKFGSSVSLDGDTALVGAWGAGDAGAWSGAVYVFSRSADGEWSEDDRLVADDAQAYAYFGRAVSLDEDTALIGAHGDNSRSGSAYVFGFSEGGWTQLGKLAFEDDSSVDLDDFGYSVALDDGVAVVGAPYADINGYHSGTAVVFTDNGSGFVEQARLIPEDAGMFDNFGYSVSVADGEILVGARGQDTYRGAAYVFTEVDGEWIQQAKLVDASGDEYDSFGHSVSILGDTALVSASADDASADYGGSAAIYRRVGTDWIQGERLVSDETVAGESFGWTVALGEDSAMVGVPGYYNQSGDGKVYAYEFHCGFGQPVAAGQWSMMALPCEPGAASSVADAFGAVLGEDGHGTSWFVYRRDEARDVYELMDIDDTLEQGRGYWVYSENSAVIGVDGSATEYVTSDDCPDAAGCYRITLTAPDTVIDERLNLVGVPGLSSRSWADTRIVVGGSSYTPSEAETAGYVSKTIWKYNGNGYDAFDDATPAMQGTLEPSEGFWVRVLGDAAGTDVELLIPASADDAAEEDGATGDYVRLIASAPDEGLEDRNAVLGRIEGADFGYDSYDLPGLSPTEAPGEGSWLTVVFPHDDWQDDAGDYASDYHPSFSHSERKSRDTWSFEVRSDDSDREVTLSWEVNWADDGEVEKMFLEDTATGETVAATTDGSVNEYRFSMDGETVRGFRWVLNSGNRHGNRHPNR